MPKGYICEEWHWNANYQFTLETVNVYNYEVYNGMLDLDPFGCLKGITQGLSKSLHYAATLAFPHSIVGNAPMHCGTTQNSWSDEECHNKRKYLPQEVTFGIHMHKQARETFQYLLRKKKRYINFSWDKKVKEHGKCSMRGNLATIDLTSSLVIHENHTHISSSSLPHKR